MAQDDKQDNLTDTAANKPVDVVDKPEESKAEPKKSLTTKKKSGGYSKISNLFAKTESKGLRKIIIILIVAFVVFDIVFFTYLFFLLRGGDALYDTKPAEVIGRHVVADGNIDEVKYDSGNNLSFSKFGAEQKYPDLNIVVASSLKKISNNKLKAYASNKEPLLKDDLIVERIMLLNSDWVDYINHGSTNVLNSVMPGSPAEAKVKDWGSGYDLVSFKSLVFGELRQLDNDNYYIITEATYLFASNKDDVVWRNDIMVFRLKPVENSIKVYDIEVIPVEGDAASSTPTASSDATPAQ